MSGFEIAGVVLGSMPLVIEGLKVYMRGAETMRKWWTVEKELRRLILSLETERDILQNVCEKLLVGIAPVNQLEEMICDPFGPLWSSEDMVAKVRLRLWKSYKTFVERARDLRDAVAEMMEKLDIGTDGKVQWLESTPLMREYKRLSFVLKQPGYKELLTRIRDGVSALQTLAVLNIELESDRKRRSQGRLATLVRGISSSIYQALRPTIACPAKHGVAIQLTANRTILPHDEDKVVEDALQFCLAISHGDDGQMRWDQLLIQHLAGPMSPAVPASRPRRTVRWSSQSHVSQGPSMSSSSSSVTLSSTAVSLSLTAFRLPPSQTGDQQIADLCEELTKLALHERGSGRCVGYIKDPSPKCRRYGVYEHKVGADMRLSSLKSVLANSQGNTMSQMAATATATATTTTATTAAAGLFYGDKLRLAWYLARNMLHLHGTAWVPAALGQDDLLIAQRADGHLQDVFIRTEMSATAPLPAPPTAAAATSASAKHTTSTTPSTAIIASSVPAPTAGSGSQTSATAVAAIAPAIHGPETPLAPPSHHYSSTTGLLAVGTLLIELMLGRSVAGSCPLEAAAMARLLNEVGMVGGPGYCSAVQRCIKQQPPCTHETRHIGGNDVCAGLSETYAGIAGLLEEDMRVLGLAI